MSVVISATPKRDHKEGPYSSYWNCSRHPAIFTFIRKDSAITTFLSVGGKLRIVLTSPNPTSVFYDAVVGSSIAVADNNNAYNKVGTITAVVLPGTPDFIFDTDINFVGSPPAGGWVNLLDVKNYYLDVAIYGKPPIIGQTVPYGSARVSVNAFGYGTLDVHEYLNGYIKKINAFQYAVRNQMDPHVWGQYRIEYRERWVGKVAGPYTVDLGIYYFVDATKYLKSPYGQNLCDYVPFNATLTNKAKFLTDFEKPTYWQGLPFSLSFIFPIELTSRTVGMTANEEQFDKSGASLGPNDWALSIVKNFGVQRLTLDATMTGTPYPDYVGELDYWINTGDIPAETYLVDTYIDPDYYETLPPVTLTPTQVSEKKRIKVATTCPENLFFVAWRNSKGGWSYWAFQKTQEYANTIKVGGYFGTEPQDLEYAMEREVSTFIDHAEKVTVGALVDIEDLDGLKFIESSPRVQLLLNPFDTLNPPSWLTLKINPKGTKYRSDAQRVEVEFDFYLPDFYTVPN